MIFHCFLNIIPGYARASIISHEYSVCLHQVAPFPALPAAGFAAAFPIISAYYSTAPFLFPDDIITQGQSMPASRNAELGRDDIAAVEFHTAPMLEAAFLSRPIR